MDRIFTVNNILDILMRRLWLIVVLVCLGGGVAYTYSEYVLPKKYTSSVTLYVYNQSANQQQLTSSDFALSAKLVDTYMVILKSDYVLEKVSDKVKEQNLDYSASSIRSMLSSEAVEETEVFKVSVSTYNKEDAKTIADAIAEIAPDEIIRVVKAGAVEIVDTAKLPSTYSSPNIAKNTIIGIILGMIFACVLSLLLELMNTTIKSREDLVDVHKHPVLAVIPNLDGATGRSYSYKKRQRGRYYYNYYYYSGYNNQGYAYGYGYGNQPSEDIDADNTAENTDSEVKRNG